MKNKSLREATGTMSSGKYKVPLNLAPQTWNREVLEPFITPVSNYVSSDNAYDSYDGSMEKSPQEIKKLETLAKKMSKIAKSMFSQNDPDGNPINGYIPQGDKHSGTPEYIKKIAKIPKSEYKNVLVKEATESSWNSGEYNVPLSHGARNWEKNYLSPFEIEVDHIHTHHSKKNKLDDLIVHHIKSLTEEKINEDLAVWFGTKKKPKGSKQPKGPWVNICRKKEGGGHPPCGRPEAKSSGYPKCRAAGVASKMTDAQKKAACAQKRKAEKSNPKTGTGNKPKMVSYKPKKSLKETIIDVLRNY
jgi:hypothetical protein